MIGAVGSEWLVIRSKSVSRLSAASPRMPSVLDSWLISAGSSSIRIIVCEESRSLISVEVPTARITSLLSTRSFSGLKRGSKLPSERGCRADRIPFPLLLLTTGLPKYSAIFVTSVPLSDAPTPTQRSGRLASTRSRAALSN